MAQAEGFFAKDGLNVNVTYPPAANGGLQGIITGSIDVFVTNPDTGALAQNKGAPITGISGALNSPFSLVGAPGVHSITDVKGKKVGTAIVGSADGALVQAMLSAGGVKPGEYQLVSTGSGAAKLAALEAGSVDVVTQTGPNDLKYLAAEPKAKILGSTSTLGPLQTTVAFANRPWAESHKTAVVAFLRAQLKAVNWLSNPANEDAAITILEKATKSTPAVARDEYNMYSKAGVLKNGIDVSTDGVTKWLEMAGTAEHVTFKPASTYLNLSYLNEAKANPAG